MSAVREFMTTDPVTISRTTTASDAARLMRDADVGILPVVEDGILQGVVTDRDLTVGPLAQRGDDARVSEFMTEKPVTISPDATVEEAQQAMSTHGVRRLVVCDDNRIVGMVSVGDLAVEVSHTAAGAVMQETGPEDRHGQVRR